MEETTYKRVLLKVSGEALAGEKRHGLDFGIISRVCDVIKAAWSAPGPTRWECWAPS